MSLFEYPFVRYLIRNAIRQGRLHEVERLIDFVDMYEEVWMDLYRHEPPMCLARATGNRGLVDMELMHADNQPNLSTSVLGKAVLLDAAELGCEQTVEMLLKWGIDVSSRTGDGLTPLHLAALGGHEGVVRLLIKYGANVKDKDSNNQNFTALHMICFEGHCELVSVLIDAGANVNEPSREGIAPLHIAAEKGHALMVRELLESGAEVDVLTCSHWTSLDCAVLNGQIEVVTLLIEYSASLDGNRGGSGTPLHHAVRDQDCAMVKLLLDHGAEVDPRALVLACDSSDDPDDQIVHLLLAHGVDVNYEDSGGFTALHRAILNSRKAVVELLLERGANVNHPTLFGNTPLELACRRAVYSPLTVMMLLEYGANFPLEHEILNCSNAYFDENGDFEEMRVIAREPLDVFELFFTKLQTADLCSPDKVFVFPPGLHPTLDRDCKEKYRRFCAKEVSSMKKEMIGSSRVSYHEFLRRTDAICRNNEVTEALPIDFRARFPHYGLMLNVRARKALHRWKLITRSYLFFPRLMKFDFPIIVTDRVFSYLSDQDLENMINVFKKPTSR